MSNPHWRKESREPVGAESSPKKEGTMPQAPSGTQTKGFNNGQKGRKGWALGKSENPWPSNPKGGKQMSGEKQGGASVNRKDPDMPNGGSQPNSSNRAKKQGWAL